MGQVFLRQAAGLPELSQLDGHYLAYVHTREATFLKSISPRIFSTKCCATSVAHKSFNLSTPSSDVALIQKLAELRRGDL
jgi:hypothetical protein